MSEKEAEVYFGKHKGKQLCDVPRGYLRWAVDNIDPVPLPKDTRGLTLEQINHMEERMRNFLSLAETELLNRDQDDAQ